MRRIVLLALTVSGALMAAGCHKTTTDNADNAASDNVAAPDAGTITNDSSADAAMNSVGDDDANNSEMNPQLGGSNGGR